MVNIRDIAKKANVSVATVSRVTNKTSYVSKKLIDKVEKTMAELNYKPNLLAGSLRKKKTGTIGLVIPDSSNMLLADISKCFEDIFFSKNYNIIICNSAYNIEREIEHLKNLRLKRVDGILIIPVLRESYLIETIRESGIPIVLLDRKIQNLKIDYVLPDNYGSGYLAGKYLTDLGHKNIGYIDKFNPHHNSTEMKRGLKNALRESGLALNNNFVKSELTYIGGAKAVKELIRKNKKITAISTLSDVLAIGAIRSLHDMGRRVPEDISVMGYDDIAVSLSVIPNLTTIHYPIEEMATEGSKILLDKMENPILKDYKEIIIEPKLVIRESTKKR